jgi:hypothetical protein
MSGLEVWIEKGLAQAIEDSGKSRNKISLKDICNSAPSVFGYGAQATPENHIKLSLPNPMDDLEVANFKARVRSRHESFNGRLKFYKSLSDTYHHSPANHVHVFEAICVTVQYQMDNGAEIFAA